MYLAVVKTAMMITLNRDVNYEILIIISMYSKQSIWGAAGTGTYRT